MIEPVGELLLCVELLLLRIRRMAQLAARLFLRRLPTTAVLSRIGV